MPAVTRPTSLAGFGNGASARTFCPSMTRSKRWLSVRNTTRSEYQRSAVAGRSFRPEATSVNCPSRIAMLAAARSSEPLMSSRSSRPEVRSTRIRASTCTTPASPENRVAAVTWPSFAVFVTRRLRSTGSGNAATATAPGPDASAVQPAGTLPTRASLKSCRRLSEAASAGVVGRLPRSPRPVAVQPLTSATAVRTDTSGRTAGHLTTAGRRSAATTSEHLRDRPQHHLEVQPERPVLNVIVVEPGAVGDRRVTPQATDLGESGESHRRPVAHGVVRVFGGELLDEVRPLGPRPDHGHVTTEDVPELGQLVQGEAAHEPADRADPLVGRDRPVRLRFPLVARAHRTELDDPDRPAIVPDPLLVEEDAGAAVEERQDHAEQEHRAQHEQCDRGEDDVRETFDGPPRTGQGGVSDLHDRDRTDVVGGRSVGT